MPHDASDGNADRGSRASDREAGSGSGPASTGGMSEDWLAGMAEATRLTRAGRLAEATQLIQRILHGRNPATGKKAPPQHGVRISPVTEQAGQQATVPPPALHADPAGSVTLLPPPSTPARTRTQPSMPDSPRTLADVWAPGYCITGTFGNSHGSRDYKLYVPTRYTGEPVPLLVMLHGCAQSADDFAAGTGMNRLAEAHTFLVAYPLQTSDANASRCWNWFRPKDQQRGIGEPSLLAGITQQIMSTHAVDPARVYVAGLSSGAAMALILGETYPDLFSAVGAHSGLAPGAAHNLPSAFAAMRGRRKRAPTPRENARAPGGGNRHRIPIILFQGDGDKTVNRSNADQIIEHWIADADGRARDELRITQEHGQATGSRTYARSCYLAAGGVPIVEKWIVHHLGHAWSGGSALGSFTDPNGPDATAEMVRFFREHPKHSWQAPRNKAPRDRRYDMQ